MNTTKIADVLIEEARAKKRTAMVQVLDWKDDDYMFLLGKLATAVLMSCAKTVGRTDGVWKKDETITLLGVPVEIVGDEFEIRLMKEIK